MSLKLTLCSIVILNLAALCASDKPYQVTIWLKQNIKNFPDSKPICNGVVVHERLILTTANCLRNITATANKREMMMADAAAAATTDANGMTAPPSNEISFVPLNASEIFVLAGDSNGFKYDFGSSDIANMQQQNYIVNNVLSIDLAENFNATSLENDMALLTLNVSLPLATRTDIKWINLDDYLSYKDLTCSFGFHNMIGQNHQESYLVKIMNNSSCTNTTAFQSPRRRDICSSYFNPSICTLTPVDLEYSRDRGTGLVCDSKLIGLLSQIIPSESSSCSGTDALKAIYTRVALHFNWIYTKIAFEERVKFGKPNSVLATAYDEASPSSHMQQPGLVTTNQTASTNQSDSVNQRDVDLQANGTVIATNATMLNNTSGNAMPDRSDEPAMNPVATKMNTTMATNATASTNSTMLTQITTVSPNKMTTTVYNKPAAANGTVPMNATNTIKPSKSKASAAASFDVIAMAVVLLASLHSKL